MNIPDPGARILYDKPAASHMLSCTEREIDELRRGGRLAAVRHGRRWKFTHAELQRFADSLTEAAS